MSAITPSQLYTYAASAALAPLSVISSQIEILEGKTLELIREITTPKTLSLAEAQRVVNDARDLLAHYHHAVSQLMTPRASRDPEVLYFDKDGSSVTVDEEPTSAETDRCKSLLKAIESCGLNLSNPQAVKSYQILAYKTEQIFRRIAEIEHTMKDPIAKFSAKGSPEISALELEGVKNVTDELNEKMLIVCEIIDLHTSEKVNRFTLDGRDRFVQVAILSNQIGKAIFQTILNAAEEQISKLKEGQAEDAPTPFSERLFDILDTADQMLGHIFENEALSRPTQMQGASCQRPDTPSSILRLDLSTLAAIPNPTG